MLSLPDTICVEIAKTNFELCVESQNHQKVHEIFINFCSFHKFIAIFSSITSILRSSVHTAFSPIINQDQHLYFWQLLRERRWNDGKTSEKCCHVETSSRNESFKAMVYMRKSTEKWELQTKTSLNNVPQLASNCIDVTGVCLSDKQDFAPCLLIVYGK